MALLCFALPFRYFPFIQLTFQMCTIKYTLPALTMPEMLFSFNLLSDALFNSLVCMLCEKENEMFRSGLVIQQH